MQRNLGQAFSTLLLALTPMLGGCLGHTRVVPKTRVASVVMGASLDQLVKQIDTRYNAIQTMNALIEISGISGGALQGEVKESVSFGGYLFIRKPEDIRIYLKVPFVSSLAMDMTSDGKNFKLYIPSKHKFVVGTNQVTTPSKNGLENLRPDVFFDSLLIHGVGDDELVSMTLDTHVVDNSAVKKGDLIEEPEYQLSILAKPKGTEVHTLRVIHIDRANLLPYKQEIYDDSGQIVTRSLYSNFQMFGDIQYPTRIQIERPLDHYGLNLNITKLQFNQKLEDDQFDMPTPEGVPVQKME
ncbi:outer membrane lipoprotein-sorting protein [Granulicella arctica]|uniref:outer membrane lipoprotein-sorting protein n=1 Tax=Granulicella arctica TaxID=940613 RepID=UPI0021DF4FDF|nr:outer membrane lipoprotein-sorting protein [Granulicella arctica]